MTKLKKTAILDDDGKIIGYEAKAKNIQIRVCKKKDADPIIIANHYSHKVTRNSFLSFLVYYEGKVSGALQIGYGTNPRKKVHPEIKHLISYADNSSDVGNEGTIYKAANYRQIDKIKSDFYILETGERVHPITMWHRHGTRRWAFLQEHYPNIKKSDGYQIKYVYDL